MVKVNRINTSQIEGGYSNDSDKRPNGEMALYNDDNGGFDLVIHDGINSTSLNKVLGKGKLYGHGEDSGDGNGYDTIKLIPDIQAYSDGSHQYIVIDPTAPNHIHLRAGGTTDNSNAELIIGGENSYFKVGAGENPALSVSSNNNIWRFDTNGTLDLPPNGLKFSDNTTQTTAWNGSINSNNLGDYSTNTFTPSFGGSISNPGINYAIRYGNYIKIGKLINFNIRIQNAIKNSSGVGDLRIIDLPFLSSATNAGYSTGVVRHIGGVFGDARPATAFYISPNTNYISLMNDGTNIGVDNIGSTSEMILSGFYFVD